MRRNQADEDALPFAIVVDAAPGYRQDRGYNVWRDKLGEVVISAKGYPCQTEARMVFPTREAAEAYLAENRAVLERRCAGARGQWASDFRGLVVMRAERQDSYIYAH